jgi:ribonuclease J
LDSAKKWNRKVFLSGRSLIDNIAIAERLNYLKIPKGLINDIRHAEKVPGKDSLILTTGSQGEAVSALTRISLKDHKHIKIKKGDTVVISATPIIGNERAINTVIDNLTMLGARVINNKIMDVHTSGHACQEDLKMMIGLVKPKYFVPVHGQYHMRYAHKELAVSMGIPEQNCIMINNGNILELKNKKLRVSKEKAETNYILVDGLGMGDSGSRVIVERQKLAENGVIVVTLKINKKTKRLIGTPSIETRGFIYLKESEEIVKEVKKKIKTKYIHLLKKHPKPGEHNIKQYIASVIDKYTHKKLARRPLIVPIVVEV